MTTSTVGHNKFSDWTESEKKKLGGLASKRVVKSENDEFTSLVVSDIPTEVNWVTAGGVNPVQDQGNCGSCWAFSAIATVEGAHFVKTGELLKLSEQQCVDCDKDSNGCRGGWPDNCMYYIMDNGGVSLNSVYPYKAISEICFAAYNGPVNVKKVHPIKSYNESALMTAIAQGPTSVTVDSSDTVLHHYTSGVISEGCGTKLDHAVVAVGYGHDKATDLDYYLVRNSWGPEWGDQGYFKVARTGDGYGTCGIQEISIWAETS